MTPAVFVYPGREIHMFIAPERTRGAGVGNDKGKRGEGPYRGIDGDRTSTKQPEKEGKAT